MVHSVLSKLRFEIAAPCQVGLLILVGSNSQEIILILMLGSPHEKGCTYTALEEVAKILNAEGIETEIFQLGTKPLSGCIACGNCAKTGHCVFFDRVNDFLDIAKDADGFIFGSPRTCTLKFSGIQDG